MLGGAALVSAYMPGALEVLPESYTLTRAAVAGLLVGTGASLGNGCTSGHGIAGNARCVHVHEGVCMCSYGLAKHTLAHRWWHPKEQVAESSHAESSLSMQQATDAFLSDCRAFDEAQSSQDRPGLTSEA